jgi:hypothetical protein
VLVLVLVLGNVGLRPLSSFPVSLSTRHPLTPLGCRRAAETRRTLRVHFQEQ